MEGGSENIDFTIYTTLIYFTIFGSKNCLVDRISAWRRERVVSAFPLFW